MPKSALRYVKVDRCLPLAEIPHLLVQLSKQPAAEQQAYPMTEEIEIESKIAEQQINTQELLENVEAIGTGQLTPALNATAASGKLTNQSRCGFAVTRGTPIRLIHFWQSKLRIWRRRWSAARIMEEKVIFFRQMSERMGNYNLQSAAAKYDDHAKSLDAEVSLIRGIILNGFAMKQNIVETDEEEPQ